MLQDSELYHHGIKGMHWGIRRWQNPDGSLTPAGKKHYEKADARWAKRNNDKLITKTQKKVSREMKKFEKELSKQPGFRNSNGKISKKAINAYNRKMADAMNKKVGTITSPSGRVVRFVAKRGEVGVQMALADPSYDMGKVANGVWSDGRVAYKSQSLNKINI